MRKGFIYSLAALATMPVAGNAAEGTTITDAVVNSKWQGSAATPTINKDEVTWSQGSISLSLGNRVAGKYTFKLAIANPDGKVNVTIAGKTNTYDAAAYQEQTVEFELTAGAEVKVEIAPAVANGKTYVISGAELSFDAVNFDAPLARLNEQISTVSDQVLKCIYDTKENERLRLGAIAKQIKAITASKTYKDYVDNGLGDVDNCTLVSEIKTVGTDAAGFDNTYAYTKSKDAIKAITDTGKSFDLLAQKVNAGTDADAKTELGNIQTLINTYNTDLETANTAKTAVDFYVNTRAGQISIINAKITSLSAKFDKALGYRNLVMTAAGLSEAKYYLKLAELQSILNVDPYKSDWYAAEKAAFDEKLAVITSVKNETDAAYQSGLLVETKTSSNQVVYTDEIAKLPTEAFFANIVKDYTAKVTPLNDNHTANVAVITGLNTALNNISANTYLQADSRYSATISPEINSIRTAISTLSTSTVEAQYSAHKTVDISATQAKLQTRINNLAGYVTAENAFFTSEHTFTKDQSEIAKTKYKYYDYTASSKWPATISDINKDLKALKTAADGVYTAANTGGKVGTYNSSVTAVNAKITNYYKDAKNAFAAYKTRKDKSIAYNAAYTEIEAKLDANATLRDADPAKYRLTGDSYATQLTTFKAQIDAYDKAITDAIALADTPHYTALKAIATNAILDGIVGDNKTTYEATIDANAAALTKYTNLDTWNSSISAKLKAVNEKLTTLSAAKATDAASVYGAGAQFLDKIVADYNNKVVLRDAYTATFDKYKTDDNIKTLALYNTAIDALQQVDGDLDLLKNELEASVLYANRCKENKTDYDAINTKMAALLTKLATTKAYVQNTDTPVSTDAAFVQYWNNGTNDITKKVTTIKGKITTSYNNFTMHDDLAGYESSYTTIDATLDQITKDADYQMGLYTASKTAYDALQVKLTDVVNNVITTAQSNCKKNDPGAGGTYYADVVLGKDGTIVSSTLATLKADIEYANNHRNCQNLVDGLTGFNQQISDLIDAINAVPGKAAHNLQNYQTVKGYESEITTRWNEVNNTITADTKMADDVKAVFKDRLNTILTEDVKFYEDNDTELYGQGKFNDDTELTDKGTAKTVLLAKINKVLSDQTGNLNSPLYSANQAQYEAFTQHLKEAELLFVSDGDFVNQCKVLFTPSLQTIATALFGESAYAELKDLFFEGKFKSDFNTLKDKANANYLSSQSSVPMATFGSENNPESGYYQEVTGLISTLNMNVNPFKTDMITQAKGVWNNLNYAATLQVVKNNINNNFNDAAKKAVDFSSLDTQIDKANKAITNQDIKSLDEAMSSLSVNFAKVLADNEQKAAVADITPQLTTAETTSKDDITFLNGLKVNDDVKKTLVDKYKSDVDSKLSAETTGARSIYTANATSLYGVRTSILNAITAFNSARTANDIEELMAQQKNVTTVNAALNNLDPILTSAINTVNSYYISDKFQTDINNLKTELASKKTAANSTYASSGYTLDVTQFVTDFKAEIKALVNDATVSEFTQLMTDDTNQFATFSGLPAATRTANAAIGTEITAIRAKLAQVDCTKIEDATKDDYAPIVLAGLEKQLAVNGTALAVVVDKNASSSILTDLRKQLSDLTAQANVSSEAAYVQKVVASQLAIVNKDITAATNYVNGIEADKTVVYYKNQAQSKIDAAKADIATLTSQITAAKAKLAASEAVYAEIMKSVNTLVNGDLQKAKDRVAANIYWTSDNQKKINDRISAIDQAISDLNTAIEAKRADAAVDVTLKTADEAALKVQADKLPAILDDAAKYEIGDGVVALNAKADALTTLYKSKVYSSARQKEYTDAIVAIKNEVKAVSDASATWSNTLLDKTETTFAGIETEIKNLTVKLTNYTFGDANNNGEVESTDFDALISYVIGKVTMPDAGTERFKTLDLNGDGQITVSDAVKLVNILMGDTSSSSANAYMPNVTEALSLQTVSESNNVTRVAINLNNAKAYVAYQMDVKLPSNMKLVGQSLTSRANAHEIFTGEVDGSTRIVAASFANNAFAGNEGAVLYLDIETVGNFDASQIGFSNIYFVTRDAQQTEMSLGSQTTGINSVGTTESLKNKIYNVGGKLMNQIKKGINILRNNDGSTQKVIKK